MGYSDDYIKLRNKRKKTNSASTKSTSSKTNGNPFSDYMSYRSSKISEAEKESALSWRNDEIAPVKKAQSSSSVNSTKYEDEIAPTKETDWGSVYQEALRFQTEATNARVGLSSKKGRGYITQKAKADSEKEKLNSYLKQYGFKDIKELKTAADNQNAKKEATKQANTLNKKWGKYMSASDYSTNSATGESKIKDVGWKIWEDRGDDVYDFINNIDDYQDFVKAASMGNGSANAEYGEYTKYRYLTDEEKGIYNYVYAKEGKEKANEFLKDIDEYLEARHGQDFYDNMSGLQKGLYWLPSGLDKWAGDVEQFFSDEKKATSYTQHASGLVKEEAYENSYLLGNLYTAGETVSNQIPNILLTKGAGSIAGSLGASASVATKIGQAAGSVGMFTSSAGGAYGQALEMGKSKEEARTYSTIVGALEAGLQTAMGGISAYGGISESALMGKVALIENTALRMVSKYGLQIGAEIAEEELQLWLEPLARTVVFGDEYDAPELEEMVETAFITAISTGVLNSASNISEGTKVNGMTVGDAKVVDKLYKDAIAEAEKDGKKLSSKEKNKRYDNIVERMDKGDIDIDTIEEVLGGETFEEYKNITEQEKALTDEISQLENTPETQFTVKQRERLTEAREELKNITNKDELKTKLSDEVYGIAKNGRLVESYNEKARKSQAFEADLTQYTGKQRESVERAIKSGVLNNTNKSHALVDTLSKIEADKGIIFDFTDNAKLKESGFAIEGKTVNGFEKNGTVTLNVQSAKSWQSTVGHEITHTLEGTESYGELQKALFEYAESKGELASRKATLTELYKNIDADIDKELTADLVGDYLFSDKDFINRLTGNRNLFQKIYDEIKYLCKVATGKELTEIEKVKHEFDKVWKEFSTEGINEATDSEIDDVNYSVSVEDKQTLDFLNEQVSRGEYNAETNPNGGYYVTYKSMSYWGTDENGNAILRSPMAEYVDGELSNAYLIPKDKSKLNWYQATETLDENTGLPSGLMVKTKKDGNKSFSYLPAAENQDLIAEDWSNLYFNLQKKVLKNGKWVKSDVPARYNPYEHSSNSMLNDQFSAAYLRDNLVTVKMYVPISEDNGAFRAKWSKDPTGWADWKTGTVAGKINKQKDLQRKVYLSRYAAPVEIVPDSEVAQAYKEYLEGTDVTIPDNVVSPSLLNELKKAGVPITESGKVKYSVSADSEGNNLSKEQSEYFKDSKVRDNNGNLLVVYHGSPKGNTTIFDKSKTSEYNDMGRGIYFSTDLNDASEYMDESKHSKVYSAYINITKPFIVSNDVKMSFAEATELLKLCDDKIIASDVYQYLKRETKNGYVTTSQFANSNVSTNMTEMLEKSKKYDGIIDETVSVKFGLKEGTKHIIVLDSNQIKETTNKTPTSDPDIRYSVSKDSDGNELSLAVQKRFANSKAVDENGNLKVLYHGTYNGEFYTFDKSKGSVEGDFGSGFYFTDNESDVENNYEGGGADFENKVARRAEQIEFDEEIDYHEAEARAREELYKGSNKHTVYLNIENPAIVGETNLLDYESFAEEYDREDYDSDEEYEGDIEQLIYDEIDQIIWDIDRNVDVYTTDGISEVLWNAVNEGGIDIEQLKANINNLYLEDNNGNLVGNEVTRQIIESLGYDGIIDNTVSTKFNMNLEEGTTHYIVFKPNQIKSIGNQNPTDNPDIRYSLSNNPLDNEEGLVYNVNRGEGYAATDEFRNLQAECQGMSDEDIQLYHSGNKQIDEQLRTNLARVLRAQIDSYRNGLRYDDGVLSLTNKGNEFNMCKSVDGSLFHDVFEIAQKYLRNGELVDLHTVETTDDGIGYNDCYNYLSEDGLSGFSITPEGDLISVFNSSGKSGFLGAISPVVKENAKTLDCYNSPNQPLRGMYEKVFGFKTASLMDYNMEYDHDNIAENHGMPQIAFMVNTESDVETREFTKDQYDEAVTYRNGFVMSENIAPVKNSLSFEGEQPSTAGTPLKELALAPMQEDISAMENKESATETVVENATVEEAPMPTDTIPKSVKIADGTRGDELLNESLDNYPMETVEQKVAEKIRAIEGEIADNKDLRREAETNYNNQIAELQKRYNAKKNKNTKVANQILQSISRLERLKASAEADYAKRISDLEARAEKMKDPKYSRAMYKQAKMQEHAKWAENLLGDTTTWEDKKIGLQYATNTERRNLRDIVRDENGNKDIARADAIDDALNGQYNREEAAKKRELAQIRGKYAELKITKAEDTYAQMLGELRHNPDTTLTEKVVNEYYEKHKNKIDTEKVEKIISLARQDYDNLLNRVNEKLREQGMKEIPYRQGYFPHFTEPKQNFIQKLLNWKTQDNEIPTSIAGLTETFKPVKSWQSFDKTRYSDETDYSFTKGFDSYSQGALDWVHHLDTLQKRRAVENHIRYTHSDEGIQARIKEVYANEELDANEAQAQIEHILAEAKNPLNNFIQDFTTHTNILAGKKNSLDRTVEQWTNRHIYSVMTNVQNRMSANMVLANVRSALTNFIPITQSWAQVSPMRSLQATKDTIANAIKDDGMIDKSTFLTNRLKKVDNLYNTAWDKVLDKAGIMFEVIDNFSSQVIWRSKYNQNIAKGMTESEAIANADQFAENVMAGRSKGNEPTLFNAKNPFVKAFTMFQLEVNNQYGYFFKDVPNDLKAETNHWKLNLAKGYTTAFIGAYVYNALLEQVAGSGAALDPIGIIEDLLRDLGLFDDDEEKEPAEVVTNFAENVVQELPFVGGLFGGGRIPISSALPYENDGFTGFVEDVSEGNWGNIGKEMMNPILNVGLPVGGGQIKKTVQGLNMFNTDEEHPVAGSYTDSGALRFPVEDTLANRIQAGIFGQYASENAREYFDNGYAPLEEKQIQEYVDVDLPIADYWKYREGLKGLDKNAEKADYINSLDIKDWQKNLLMNNILDRKEDVDMSNYDDYSSFEEFDYAQKNPEKYDFFKANGISYSDYANADEDGKAAYTWAYNNPEKYSVSKLVADDVVTYRSYTSDLYDIKADKDANGKTINGSGKEKKIEYINNLDLDYEQKIILFKMQYKSDDTYNADIVNYLNNREDLTYDEKVTIYTELGFTVKDGYVYWD